MPKFKVRFLEDASIFLDSIEEKARDKILYNIWKSTEKTDNELFKKLNDDIWEFRTIYQKTCYRLFAFWDKNDGYDTVVISTHGIIKKTDKTPAKEIDKARKQREIYFNNK